MIVRKLSGGWVVSIGKDGPRHLTQIIDGILYIDGADEGTYRKALRQAVRDELLKAGVWNGKK
jgi:hypothetical protein